MGKTLASLSAMEDLNLVGDVYPILVLAPLRVANGTWPDEVRKWPNLKHLRVSPITGASEERKRAVARKADVYTTNYENLVWLVEHFGERWPFKVVIADESTRLKSFRTRQGGVRAKALAKIAFNKIERFVNLTGTPAPNGLIDLWGQLWFNDGGTRLGRTFTAFRNRWFSQDFNGYGVLPMKHAQGEIQGLLKDICLTIDAKDWFDLKDPIVTTIPITLPPAARSLYNDMEKQLFMEIEGHEIEAFNAAAKTQKLLQLSSGAVYLNASVDSDASPRAREWKTIHDEKLNALESIVEEAAGAPVLVAYHFKSDLARLLKRFTKGRELDKNPQTVRDWNAGKIPVLFAHPACLHPSTEVLTEMRGWVKLIDVRVTDRVFDGVEFVNHKGCSYSGYVDVMEVFGITMTPDHNLFISDGWMRAKDVRISASTRHKAVYTYKGDDCCLGKMFELHGGSRDFRAELPKAQPEKKQVLRKLHRDNVSSNDRYPFLAGVEGDEVQSRRPHRQKLRGAWNRDVPRMAGVQELLHRYVQGLLDWVNDRAYRGKQRVLQNQLSLGYEYGATSEQTYKSVLQLPRGEDTPSRSMPKVWSKQDDVMLSVSSRHDVRRGYREREDVNLRAEPEGVKKAHVYDLVDCGPRHQFVIRNRDGEAFISHNSAGHGLSLQYGGNIIVYFSHDWNLENRMQILERIGPVRQLQAGLDRPVFVYNLVATNTADELVIARVESKREVQDILLEAMKRRKQCVTLNGEK